MTQNQADSRTGRKPGRLSRWVQHKANARANRKIRSGRGTMMGMDLLILNTVGRRSGQARETPIAWFADGDGSKLVVASGGGDHHPDWYVNLMAHPDQATIELPGREPAPVRPHHLDGADREQAWQRVVDANPHIAKYQSKSDREYPVVRLTPAASA